MGTHTHSHREPNDVPEQNTFADLRSSDPGLYPKLNPADNSSPKGSCQWVCTGGLGGRKPLDPNNPPHIETGVHRKSQPVLRALQSPCRKHLIFSRILAVSEVLSGRQAQGHGETD